MEKSLSRRYPYLMDLSLQPDEIRILRGIYENGKIPNIKTDNFIIKDKNYKKRIVHRMIGKGYMTANLQVTENGLIAIGAKRKFV